jgi:hypothetical protein
MSLTFFMPRLWWASELVVDEGEAHGVSVEFNLFSKTHAAGQRLDG